MATTFSHTLEDTLRRSLQIAIDHKHEYVALEHLLVALLDDPDASEALRASRVDIDLLRKHLTQYLRTDLDSLVVELRKGEEPRPTAGFQRVLQRAMLQVDSSGRRQVTGENVLLALFSERESHATHFLQQQGITRFDAAQRIVTREALNELGAAGQTGLESKNAELESQLAVAVARITDLEQALKLAQSSRPPRSKNEPDVFISYRREQRDLVHILVNRLRVEGFLVWWDVDIPPGAPWESTIESFISSCRVVIVCWSLDAVQSESVKAEARFGLRRNKLIQTFLDDCEPPMFFGERQGLQFKGWDGSPTDDRFRQLVEALRAQI